MYTVKLKPRAQRELDSVPQERLLTIAQALQSLEQNPRPPGTIKLWDAVYRIRIGQWRVIYQIRDREQTVVIGKITRRSERTYRDIRDLF